MNRRKSNHSFYAAWLLAPLLAIAALLTLHAGPAAAAEVGATRFFGGTGTEGGKFRGAGGLAINQNGAGGVSPGDIYVADGGNRRIQELSASGEFIRAFGRGVGGPGVDVCTDAPACVAGELSAQAGGLNAPANLAIDQTTGTVYVIDGYEGGAGAQPPFNRVDVFSATGEFEGAFGWNVKAAGGAEELQFCTEESGCKAGTRGSGAGQFSSTGDDHDSVAVSPLNGHVIVGDPGNGRIDEFAPSFNAGKVVGMSFVRGLGWGVVNGAEEFQVCTVVCHAPAAGQGSEKEAELGRFAPGDHQPRGVGADQNGRIYAINGDFFARTVRIETFDSSGSPEGVEGLSVDVSNPPYGLFVNASNSDVMTIPGGNGVIRVYGPSGNLLDTYFEASSGEGINGISQNEQSEVIYFSPRGRNGIIEMGEVVPPTASIDPVSGITGTTAAFSGHVNPEGLFANFGFEYSLDGKHWQRAEGGELPADSSEHAVTGEAKGLEGSTEYQVRLVATKIFDSGSASAETSFETAPEIPVAKKPTVSAVSNVGATLEGSINPENQQASYHFECVSDAAFEESGYANAVEVPGGGATVKAASAEVKVSQPFEGLEPATGYRCRLVAENPTGAVTSPETTFATYMSQVSGLADGRVYEQATPIAKNGANASGWAGLLKAAPDGSAVSYFITGGGSGEGGGGQEFPTYAADRIGEEWQSKAFLPSSSFGERAKVSGWSEDLKRDYVLVWNSGTPATFYVQNLADGSLEEIASGLKPSAGANSPSVFYAGASTDGQKVLFESKSALTPEAMEGVSNLYVWDRESHVLSLISVLPDESSPPSGAFAGPYNWPSIEPKEGGAAASFFTQDMHVLSEDGETAFFTTSNVNQLYARTGIGGESPSTVQVSATQKTNGSGPNGRDPKGPKKAAFMEATPDGRYVFFTSQEELTNDATTGTADQGSDLYRYDTESGELIDLAPDSSDANGAEVEALIGASADGSYAYFVANGVLDEGASKGINCASPGWGGGQCNIYLWHEGTVSFVSRVGGGEANGGLNWLTTPLVGGNNRGMKTARVSRNGKALSFVTSLSPTSYDSEGKPELYRYDTEEGLECVSCNPTGAPAVGGATLQDIEPGFLKPTRPNSFLIRNLSADGNRLFFETTDKLVASDTNGELGCAKGKCQDVYEWEADGSGSCEGKAQDSGCLYLISTGESNEPSYFADASASGDDVFFFTRQSLVRQDTDQLYDVYDAKVGGGIASQNAAPPTSCEGEACRPSTSTAPAASTAASATFSGPGDPTPRRHKKHRHAKKHHKKSAKSKTKHVKQRSHR
jgi:hypothetical protein